MAMTTFERRAWSWSIALSIGLALGNWIEPQNQEPFCHASGGTGTYNVSVSQTVASSTMNAGPGLPFIVYWQCSTNDGNSTAEIFSMGWQWWFCLLPLEFVILLNVLGYGFGFVLGKLLNLGDGKGGPA